MKTRKHTILPLAALAGLAIATSANATVMTFEDLGTSVAIPDTFGDNIAAAETGISVSNGTTPNIDLTWDGSWSFYNDATWSAAYLSGYGVGNKHDLQFTPDAGFGVLVDSFVFDDYANYGNPTNKFNWFLYEDSDVGALIASGTETTADGDNLTVNTGMATAYAGTVLLRIEEHSDGVGGTWDQALDDISFTQQAIPEPSSAALLGLGGLALILRRRK
jgi:hypothetical protein